MLLIRDPGLNYNTCHTPAPKLMYNHCLVSCRNRDISLSGTMTNDGTNDGHTAATQCTPQR